MTERSKDYLLKTIVAIILMAVGAFGLHKGEEINFILGSISFLIGFTIMVVLYGLKWVWLWIQ